MVNQTDRVIELLDNFNTGEIFSTGDIADVSKFPRPSIRRVLSTLVKRGTIQRIEPGLFKIPRRENQNIKQPHSEDEINESEIETFYLSGLTYNRDIGVKISTNVGINKAEELLRTYAKSNVENFNHDFYGISSIGYNGYDEVGKIIEVNL